MLFLVFLCFLFFFFFFFQAEDGIRDTSVTGVQTCALPIFPCAAPASRCQRLQSFGSSCTACRYASTRVAPVDVSPRTTHGSGESGCQIGRASCRERV